MTCSKRKIRSSMNTGACIESASNHQRIGEDIAPKALIGPTIFKSSDAKRKQIPKSPSRVRRLFWNLFPDFWILIFTRLDYPAREEQQKQNSSCRLQCSRHQLDVSNGNISRSAASAPCAFVPEGGPFFSRSVTKGSEAHHLLGGGGSCTMIDACESESDSEPGAATPHKETARIHIHSEGIGKRSGEPRDGGQRA